MGVFKQVWEVYKENGCELTLHRSIATHLGSGLIGTAGDADAAAVAAFVAELEGFLRDPETFLLMLSVGLRGMFDTQSSFIGLLLREDALQASLIDFLLEKLSELASDLDGAAANALEKNLPKLILREIRWIDHVVDSAELVEKLTTALQVFPTALQRDVIYILPEIAGDADAYKVIDSMVELIRNEADLVVCCIEALGNFNVVNEQTNDVVKCVLERLDSSPLVDLPVIVKYLVQEAPGADVDLIAGELREKLSATLSFTETAAETASGNGRRSSTGSSAGVDPTRNEEALVLGAIIQGFYFREDLLKAFLASMSKSGTDKGAGGLCLLDMWILFGAHSIPRDRQKVERLFKKKIASGGISRSLLVKSVKGHANALKSYFGSTLQLASVLLSQQRNGVCTEMGSLMFEVLFEEFSLPRKDGKNEAEYYKGEVIIITCWWQVSLWTLIDRFMSDRS
jgi:fanconi anemia group D2 protein